MTFNASTRDLMQLLGVNDPKTLHRRREDYNDKSIHPDSQIFKLGVHYRRKSPTSPQVVWDKEVTVRAWTEATKVTSQARAVVHRSRVEEGGAA